MKCVLCGLLVYLLEVVVVFAFALCPYTHALVKQMVQERTPNLVLPFIESIGDKCNGSVLQNLQASIQCQSRSSL